MNKLYSTVPDESPSLGTLKPLTLAQMAELHYAISALLIDFAGGKPDAAAAIALQVCDMSPGRQAGIVCWSPFLLAKAAGMMLGRPKWVTSPMLAAKDISIEDVAELRKAVIRSYGLELVEEGEEVENPPKAATSPDSPSDSQPSTVGPPSESAA